MNTCNLVGHVARTPSTRFEGEGAQITTFTLSIDERSREGKVYPLYVPCTSWGKSAEACSLLSADDLVIVQGRLTWRSHKHKCGQEHSQLCVRVQDVAVLEHAAAAGFEGAG